MTLLQIYVLEILLKDNILTSPSVCILSGRVKFALFQELTLPNFVPVSIFLQLSTQKVTYNATFQLLKNFGNQTTQVEIKITSRSMQSKNILQYLQQISLPMFEYKQHHWSWESYLYRINLSGALQSQHNYPLIRLLFKVLLLLQILPFNRFAYRLIKPFFCC